MDVEGVQKGSHCIRNIHYHIVFPVKYRKDVLSEEAVWVIVEIAKRISKRYDTEIEAIGCDKDHIHLLCSAHPKIAPGQIVRIFKSITAREIFSRKPEVKRELWGGEFWMDRYYLATVGERGNWGIVEKYVQSQGKPKEELRQLKLF